MKKLSSRLEFHIIKDKSRKRYHIFYQHRHLNTNQQITTIVNCVNNNFPAIGNISIANIIKE